MKIAAIAILSAMALVALTAYPGFAQSAQSSGINCNIWKVRPLEKWKSDLIAVYKRFRAIKVTNQEIDAERRKDEERARIIGSIHQARPRYGVRSWLRKKKYNKQYFKKPHRISDWEAYAYLNIRSRGEWPEWPNRSISFDSTGHAIDAAGDVRKKLDRTKDEVSDYELIFDVIQLGLTECDKSMKAKALWLRRRDYGLWSGDTEEWR